MKKKIVLKKPFVILIAVIAVVLLAITIFNVTDDDRVVLQEGEHLSVKEIETERLFWLAYSAEHPRLVTPLFIGYDDEAGISDDEMLTFVAYNVADPNEEGGVQLAQVKYVTETYFDRHIVEYSSDIVGTKYYSSTNRLEYFFKYQLGFSDYLNLYDLYLNDDGTYTGYFERYRFYSGDADYENKVTYNNFKSGNIEDYMMSDRVKITFEKVNDGTYTYIQYVDYDQLKTTQTAALTIGDYDITSRVSFAEMSTAAGVSVGMTYDEVIDILGEFDEMYVNSDNSVHGEKFGYFYTFYTMDEAFSQQTGLPVDGNYYLFDIEISDRCIDEMFRGVKIGDSIEDIMAKLPSTNTTLQKWSYQALYGPGTYEQGKELAALEYYIPAATYRLIIQTANHGTMTLSFDGTDSLNSVVISY